MNTINQLHTRTDTFGEVINLSTFKTVWAHFASVAIYPFKLRLTGSLNISNIKIIPAYGCLR